MWLCGHKNLTTIHGAAQRQALAARAGFGRKKPKTEPVKGAESLEGRRKPALVRLHAILARFLVESLQKDFLNTVTIHRLDFFFCYKPQISFGLSKWAVWLSQFTLNLFLLLSIFHIFWYNNQQVS
jgi:hypothetical protein